MFCATFPFLYAVFPSAWFWNDGRYAIYLPPILALAVVGAIWDLTSARTARVIVVGILALTVVSTVVSFNDGFGALSSQKLLTGWHSNPNPSVTALAATLVHDDVHSVYGSYWVAYDLQYLSGDQVTGFALDNVRIPANARNVESESPCRMGIRAVFARGAGRRPIGHRDRYESGNVDATVIRGMAPRTRASLLRRRRSIRSWW